MNVDESLLLRSAHRSEAGQIALMSRLHVEHGLNWRWTNSRVRRQIDAEETMVLIASLKGVLMGFAIMSFGDIGAHLLLLAVEPRSRRTGVGSALLTWLEKSCVTAGMRSIRLEVRKSNQTAIEFYRHRNYRITDEIPRYYDRRETAVVMIRTPGF